MDIHTALEKRIRTLAERVRPNMAFNPAEDALRCTMRILAEDYWAASWPVDLEYGLWEAVFEDDSEDFPLEDSERLLLARLALEADGWWVWDKTTCREKFVSLTEWVGEF